MKPNKVLSLLGLATKAGRVASGEFMTENAIKDGSAALVIIGCDASANTTKKFRDMCAFYEVPCFSYSDKEGLGHAIGKEMRASLAVTDEGFAKSLKKLLEAAGVETEVTEWQK